MNVSELNDLEFAELLHGVCERLEKESQTVVSIARPMSEVYIVLIDDDSVFCAEHQTEDGEFFSTNMAYISKRLNYNTIP